MSKRRVVVTGLGLVSPVGTGITQAWDNLLKGVSGVGPITKFDPAGITTRIAAEVKGFDATQWMSPKEARRSDTFIHFGIAATKLALDDAGLRIDESNAERTGVMVGSGIGGLPMIEENIFEMDRKGPRRIALFRSGLHHQHGGGPHLDPVRLGPTERRAVKGVGAPSYTSGPHMCQGTAATL